MSYIVPKARAGPPHRTLDTQPESCVCRVRCGGRGERGHLLQQGRAVEGIKPQRTMGQGSRARVAFRAQLLR